MTLSSDIYSLEIFEGPLDLLFHLINRQEIDIYQINIINVIEQFLIKYKESQLFELDRSAEFVSLTASLIWFKSRKLLPKHEQQQEHHLEEELDPHFEIIHQLMDYCKFKQAAKDLSVRQEQQSAYYSRGIENPEVKKNLGLDHLSLDDLSLLFQQVLAKSVPQIDIIKEEEWKVGDKIFFLRQLLIKQKKIEFTKIFNSLMSRIELIVLFLALLEMMKSGEIKVIKESQKKDFEQMIIYLIATS